MKINREDMLELTRRMTVKRNCFSRVAGAYMDAEGMIDGTFNVDFRDLTVGEQEENLKIAKQIPFSKTNIELLGYEYRKSIGTDSMKKILLALNESRLKNDALLEVLYDAISQSYQPGREYAVILFQGCYDVPVKGTDHERLDDSEEVYEFLVGSICPMKAEYEADLPEAGFLFPMFTNRSSDSRHVAIYQKGESRAKKGLMDVLGLQEV